MMSKKVIFGVGTLLGAGVTAGCGYGLYKEIKAERAAIPMQPVDAIEADDDDEAEEAE